jgi:hypothetical protein
MPIEHRRACSQRGAESRAADPQREAPTPFSANRSLIAADPAGLRRALVALQRDAGNTATWRAVQRAPGAPAPTFGTGLTGEPMRGVSPARTAYVQECIDQGLFDAAVSAMVTWLEEDGELDPALLKNRTMVYEAGLSPADGAVSPPGFDYSQLVYPPPAEKCNVRIGPGAFAGVAYLHSVMMHEYQHVLGYQTMDGQKRENAPVAEVNAYGWEILNAKLTKLDRDPVRISQQWEHLIEEWPNLTAQQATTSRPFAQRVRRAAVSLIGHRATLSPAP